MRMNLKINVWPYQVLVHRAPICPILNSVGSKTHGKAEILVAYELGHDLEDARFAARPRITCYNRF